MKCRYKPEELHLKDDSPEEHSRVRETFNKLRDRAVQNKPLFEYEKDFLGRCLKFSIVDHETIDDFPSLDNSKFKSLYLVYFRDLNGAGIYTKYAGYDEKKGHLLYNPPQSEVQQDLHYLIGKAEEWNGLINSTAQPNELMKETSIEARNEIHELEKIPEFQNDPYYKGRFRYRNKRKAVLLQSKYIHCLALELFETHAPSDFILNLYGYEVEITPYLIIHILTRHFSQITKQYPTTKSFHNEEFKPGLLGIELKKIFEEIDKSHIIKTFPTTNIQFRYRNTDYSLWISKKSKTVKGEGTIEYLRVDTFYPIEERQALDKLKKEYKLQMINSDLGVYLLFTKGKY
jgi:hypothetical protein